MQITFLSYFLSSAISYLGLLIGIILISIAPEEQKPGKRYFILLKKILFFLIVALPLYYYKINLIFSLIVSVFIAALMLGNKLRLDKSYLVYFLLGVIFFLSSRFVDLFSIESVLILLYGIPNASLILDIKRKNYYDIFVKNLLFFIPVALLYFFV